MKERATTKDWLIALVFILICVGLIVAIENVGYNKYDTPPVKGTVNVDSILNTNDSIKYVIKQKDSIKYEEVFNVRNLDNDSTVKLFKELVRE